MKENTHPVYVAAAVTCACGTVHQTASTKGSFRVDICSACHPFYTGKQKRLDQDGRVEKFRKKYNRQ
jgi:large subunit ribosomal protein L31